MKKNLPIILLSLTLLAVSCKKKETCGNVAIQVGYSVNGGPLATDSLCYVNEAGNKFLIAEMQWFVSKMAFQTKQGEWVDAHGIFYIDTDIPESQTLEIKSLPVGSYQKLRFTFGLDENDNQTGLFCDPPEANMFWPEALGGGYHYMKLNGKYLDENEQLAPLNIHLGIGQNEDYTTFYQNYFTVTLPIDFVVAENAENQLFLTMIVDNWFRNPNLYDFNDWGSAIMQNQAAQQALKENSHDVFTIQTTENQNDIAMKKNEIIEQFNGIMQKAAPKPHFWSWENVKERVRSWKLGVES